MNEVTLADSEVAQPSETQGGPVPEESTTALVDTYLHRKFTVGELLPWKGVTFEIIGIRGGVIGLVVKSIPVPPKARPNLGKRPSRQRR